MDAARTVRVAKAVFGESRFAVLTELADTLTVTNPAVEKLANELGCSPEMALERLDDMSQALHFRRQQRAA